VLVYLHSERKGWATVTNERGGVDEGYVTTGPAERGNIALIKVKREEQCFVESAYIKRVYRSS
jgi:hypothetical protein